MVRRVWSVAAATFGAVLLLPLVGTAWALPPVCQSGALTTTPNQRIALPPNPCADPEGDTYVVAAVTPPSNGALSNEAGTNYYTPRPGFHGPDSFTYRATDANSEVSNIATVSLLVDTAPTCGDTAASVQTGTVLVLPEPACFDPDGDALFYWLYDGLHGVVSISPQGTATYTPAPGFVGTDYVAYEAEDPFGLLSSTQAFVIDVTAAPPPTNPPATPPRPPVSPVTPAKPADLTAPSLKLAAAAKKLGAALRSGVGLRVATNEPSTVSVALTVNRATARKLGLKRNAKAPVKVGALQATVPSGSTTLTVRFSAKARRALRNARSVSVLATVVIRDAAGNRATARLAIRLKR